MPQEKYNPNHFLLYFVSVLHPQCKLCATGSHNWDASQLWPSSAVSRCIVQCQETLYIYCSVVRHIPLWVSGLPGHTVHSMWEGMYVGGCWSNLLPIWLVRSRVGLLLLATSHLHLLKEVGETFITGGARLNHHIFKQSWDKLTNCRQAGYITKLNLTQIFRDWKNAHHGCLYRHI